MENHIFNNSHILAWLQYYADNMHIDLERVRLLDITRKNKNLIPMVESHHAVLVFTEAGHPDIFYRMWNAGLGDCEVWYNEGSDPVGPIPGAGDDQPGHQRQRRHADFEPQRPVHL